MRYDLTPREMQVIRCLCDGMTNKNIGLFLGMAEDTVKRHLSSVCDKTGQSTRLEVAMFAIRKGLVAMCPLTMHEDRFLKLEEAFTRIEEDLAQSRLLLRQLSVQSQKQGKI